VLLPKSCQPVAETLDTLMQLALWLPIKTSRTSWSGVLELTEIYCCALRAANKSRNQKLSIFFKQIELWVAKVLLFV